MELALQKLNKSAKKRERDVFSPKPSVKEDLPDFTEMAVDWTFFGNEKARWICQMERVLFLQRY